MPKSRSCTLFMRSRGLAWCSKNNSGRIVGSLCLRLRVTTLDRSLAEIVRKGDRRDARHRREALPESLKHSWSCWRREPPVLEQDEW